MADCPTSIDERLRWSDDHHVELDGIPFVIMEWETTEPLAVYKLRSMLRHYLRIIDEIAPKRALELGIFRGGSVAFLATALRATRFTAVELRAKRVDALDEYLREHHLEDVVRLHYGTDQADVERLRQIVDDDFGSTALDLVIDDASHLYEPTVTSFETLFPRVRPGGYYMIEDWWGEQRVMDMLLAAFADPPAPGPGSIVDMIAAELAGPTTTGTTTMRWWIALTLSDPARGDHAVVSRWFTALEACPPSPSRDAVVAEVHEAQRAFAAGTLTDPRSLGTLAAELVVAQGVAPDAIASVTVADGLIIVQRGDRPLDVDGFRLADVANDRFGVLRRAPEPRPV